MQRPQNLCEKLIVHNDEEPIKRIPKPKKSEKPLHTPFQRLLIMDTVRRKKTPCHDKVFFTEQIDKNGWCVTCVNGSKPGEPGYCGSDMNHNEDDDNNVRIPIF